MKQIHPLFKSTTLMKTLFLFLFCVTNIFAQKTVKVEYEQRNYFPADYFEKIPEDLREQAKQKMTQTIGFCLINNGDFSLLTDEDLQLDKLDKQSPIDIKFGQTTYESVERSKIWILKDFKNNSFYELKRLALKNYIVKDTLLYTKINLSSQTKKVDKYNCKLAYVLSKKNPVDTIKYWYTQEIPIIDGPFQILNIPGLILGYEAKFKTIYVTKISFSDIKTPIVSLAKIPKIYTRKEFAALKLALTNLNEFVDEKGNKTNIKTYKYE